MKLQINYKHLAAEFVIIVVGVAVALAADNWGEELSERRVESEYLRRISDELLVGQSQLESYKSNWAIALGSTRVLIDHLEGSQNSVSEQSLVEHFTKATRTNGPVPFVGINHNSVFEELISTGRLNLISNTNLRHELTNYYRDINSVSANMSALPTDVWTRFRELTGREAADYLASDELPVGEVAQRLVQELNGSDQRLVRELRLLHSRLELLTRRLEGSAEANVKLVELLNSENFKHTEL